MLLQANNVRHIFIEQVGGGSIGGTKQSGSSMFGFGYMAGMARAIAMHVGIPYTYLTPQKWRKVVGMVGGPEGNKSRARASQLFPGCDTLWPLKKHDGRAEAALIALAGLTITNGEKNDVGSSQSDGRRVSVPASPRSKTQGKPKRGSA